MKRHWSERLREAMAERPITAAELARKAGIKESSMSAWIAGRVDNPGSRHIKKACTALRVNYDWLMDGKGEKTPETKTAGLTPEDYAAGLEVLSTSEIHAMLADLISTLPEEDRRTLSASLLRLVADGIEAGET